MDLVQTVRSAEVQVPSWGGKGFQVQARAQAGHLHGWNPVVEDSLEQEKAADAAMVTSLGDWDCETQTFHLPSLLSGCPTRRARCSAVRDAISHSAPHPA